jgi:hypothetical protein
VRFSDQVHEAAEAAVNRFFYENAIPFNVAQIRSYKRMVSFVAGVVGFVARRHTRSAPVADTR